MPRDLIFFLSALSFLSGVAFASLGLPLAVTPIPAVILFAALYASEIDLRIAIFGALLILAGSAYYLQDEYRYERAIAHVPADNIRGMVAEDPKHGADFQ